MSEPAIPYDFAFAAESAYGHSLELVGTYSQAAEGAIHLDLACGAGAIASEVESRFGATYVGVDFDQTQVDRLRAAGFEAHQADLESSSTLETLQKIIGGRPVSSITMLDGFEHLARRDGIGDALGRLSREHGCIVVVSIPNVTHRDVAVKLAFGSWAYTPTGLLDETHVRFFGERQLETELGSHGLHRIARNDVVLTNSDQHFPNDHPALQQGTTLEVLLSDLRDAAEPNAAINQFVWACVAGPVVTVPDASEQSDTPTFTVLVRTQGRRVHELQEVFTCLAAQTDQDFEVVLVAHSVDDRTTVERLVDDTPSLLRAKIRLVHVDRGNRATLLNIGFAEARGRYVTVLDDDDLVLGHWLETFRLLDRKHRGQVLRSLAVEQGASRVEVLGQQGIRATTSPEMPYEEEFSFVKHLSLNQSPFMTLAFPRALFRDLGLRFDESLTTTEDWDYLLRAASVVGVADSREIVAIYHRWVEQESSATMHDAEVWRLNELSIRRKIDSRPMLLQAGETRRIRELVESEHLYRSLVDEIPLRPEDDGRADALHRLVSLLESRSWRATSPLRWPGTVVGRREARAAAFTDSHSPDIRHAIKEIERSRSWRLSRWLLRR